MEAKKHIYIVSEYYPPLYSWLVANRQPSGMPAVHNLYTYLGDHPLYTFDAIMYNPHVDNKIKFPNGSQITLIKFNFPIYLIWKLLVIIKLIFGQHRIFTQKNIDLIYGLGSFTFIARRLGHKYKIKSVGRIFGTILTALVAKKKYRQIYTRHLLELINIKWPPDIIIATKDGTQYDQVAQHFNPAKKPYMLYNGINSSLKSQLLDHTGVKVLPTSDLIHICQISRLQSYKRVELSIEIIKILVHDYGVLNVQLTIVGSGPLKNALETLISTINVDDHIQIIDEMPHDQLMQFLEGQHIATFFYEGGSLGNIFWESALSGKLVCTVDNGDTASIIKDGVNGIIKADTPKLPKEVAEHIYHLVGKDISSMTETCRIRVEKIIKPWNERLDDEFEYIFNKGS